MTGPLRCWARRISEVLGATRMAPAQHIMFCVKEGNSAPPCHLSRASILNSRIRHAIDPRDASV